MCYNPRRFISWRLSRKGSLRLSLSTLALIALLQTAPTDTGSYHYAKGMELWRAGKPAEGLRHLMSASLDPELSFYATRQASLMGEFALQVLYAGLWHEQLEIQRQSAIILGWIGDREAVEPLLYRLGFPDAPLEVEYALRKIGGVTTPELLGFLERATLTNSALLDRQVAGFVRLSRAFAAPVDPVPVLALVEKIEETDAEELEEQPRGHLANAQLSLLLFLAERGVSKAAEPLARSIDTGAEDANLILAEALIELGPVSLPALEQVFHNPPEESLRTLLAVTHYFASGALETSMTGMVSFVLNELASAPELAVETAALVARLSGVPNPLLSWFEHHPDPEVRKVLAPVELDAEKIRSRPELRSFFLEKTRDSDPEVATEHLQVLSAYLPDPEVESRLEAILASTLGPLLLREQALEVVTRHGPTRLLVGVLQSPDDPMRLRAVELASERPEPSVVQAVLSIVQEPQPSATKRAAMAVAAEDWKRLEASAPLLDLLRSGDALWLEASRGLAALGVAEAVDPFLAMLERGAAIDPEEASALYFAFTGIPASFARSDSGDAVFQRLSLKWRPPPGKVLVVLTEKSDYQGWVKVEERWEEDRVFRLDEGAGELVLYDRGLFDQVEQGAGILLLEETVRQAVLNPLELAETRTQKARALDAFPEFPFAGLEDGKLRLLHRGEWVSVGLGKDLRDVGRDPKWGRSALVPLHLFDRERIRWSEDPPPSGWLLNDPQPAY